MLAIIILYTQNLMVIIIFFKKNFSLGMWFYLEHCVFNIWYYSRCARVTGLEGFCKTFCGTTKKILKFEDTTFENKL